MSSAAKKVAAEGDSTKKKRPLGTPVERMQAAQAPPTEHVELPKPDELASPYPKGVRYYSYQPKAGGDPILLAMNGFDVPDKLWHFDVAQLPVLSQTWKWMERAKVPKDIQRQAQSLPDAEYFGMFDEWFAAMKAQNAPKGALTVGK